MAIQHNKMGLYVEGLRGLTFSALRIASLYPIDEGFTFHSISLCRKIPIISPELMQLKKQRVLGRLINGGLISAIQYTFQNELDITLKRYSEMHAY